MKPWSLSARTASAEATRELAAALARWCRAGDLVLLIGEMGAGKTAFAQGFARGLGVTEVVTSPTFTIVREYQGDDLALHHLDVYRLDQLREVPELGVGEMLDEAAVMLVEWGDAVAPALGDQYLEIRLAFPEGSGTVHDDDDVDDVDLDERVLVVSGRGAQWASRGRAVVEALAPWAVDPEEGAPC